MASEPTLVLSDVPVAEAKLPRHRTPERVAYNANWRVENREHHLKQRRDYMREYRLQNGDKIRARTNATRAKNREHYRELSRKSAAKMYAVNPRGQYARSIRYKYGISLAERDELFAQNSGLCHICSKKVSECIDHDHNTGKVRGALCHSCNHMIGLAKEDNETLLRAITYLRKHG